MEGAVHDAPFVVAIGSSVLNSLVFPVPRGPNDDEDGDSMVESADARFAVIGIISFIDVGCLLGWKLAINVMLYMPLFTWLLT